MKHEAIDFESNIEPYAFRQGDYWYLFFDWNLPVKGKLIRWPIIDNADWDPKKIDTGSILKFHIVFDVETPPAHLDQTEIREVRFNCNGSFLSIVSEENNKFTLSIYKIENELIFLSKINDFCVESNYAWLTTSQIIYVKADNKKRPCKIFLYNIENGESNICFVEEREAYRIKVIPSHNETNAMISLSTYEKNELIYIHCNGKINKLKTNYKILDVGRITHNQLDYFFYIYQNKNDYYIDLIQNGYNFTLLIEYKNYTKIWGVKSGILLQYKSFDKICYSFIKFGNNVHEYIVNKITIEGNITIFPNNYSEKYVYFTRVVDYSIMELLKLDLNIFEVSTIDTQSLYPFSVNYKLIDVPSRDNSTSIPMSIFWSEEFVRSTDNPVMFSVYGAYGNEPLLRKQMLDEIALFFLSHGFIFCVPHVRGGNFKGKKWYSEGKGNHKWNSNWDTLDCIEYFKNNPKINHRYMNLMTVSAGGIIGGAVLNEKPQLLNRLLLFSPFINPLGSMLVKKDPLSILEKSEWGAPSEDKDDYHYIKSYSPYHHVNKAKGSRTKVDVFIGGKDNYISNSHVIEWCDNLTNLGIKVRCFLDNEAGHGGVSQSSKNRFFEYLFQIINDGKIEIV